MSIMQTEARKEMNTIGRILNEVATMDLSEVKKFKARLFENTGKTLYFATHEDQGNALQVILEAMEEVRAREYKLSVGE